MAELVADTQLSVRQNEMMVRLMRSARNLLGVLNDLLDFAKIDANRLEIEGAPFAVSQTILDVCALFRPVAEEKGVQLNGIFPKTLQNDVVGDAHLISQIASNLISNAIKFTECGSVEVCIAQENDEKGTLWTSISVIDTGIGISYEQLARLFQPFVQADTSTSCTYGGSGLGLAISRSLAEGMGGEIAVSSRPGAGSTLTVRLPLEVASGQILSETASATVLEADKEYSRQRSSAPGATRPLRVLVAEDDPTNRLLVVLRLEEAGHQVTSAKDGAAAVEAVKAAVQDIILMDAHMPNLNGTDAIRAIRAHEAENGATRRTPIIAVTADILVEHKRGFHEAGADAVIEKPIDWIALYKEVERLTGPRA